MVLKNNFCLCQYKNARSITKRIEIYSKKQEHQWLQKYAKILRIIINNNNNNNNNNDNKNNNDNNNNNNSVQSCFLCNVINQLSSKN